MKGPDWVSLRVGPPAERSKSLTRRSGGLEVCGLPCRHRPRGAAERSNSACRSGSLSESSSRWATSRAQLPQPQFQTFVIVWGLGGT